MRVANEDKLSAKMKDYKYGVTPKVYDNRTAREKAQDKTYIYQVLRTKVYDLFGNDEQMSEEFMELLSKSFITPEQFSIAYNQLKTNFKGSIVEPSEVMTNLYQLVQNYEDSGTVTGDSQRGSVRGDSTIASVMSTTKSMVSNAYSRGNLEKPVADEITDVLSIIEEETESDTLKVESEDRIDSALRKLGSILNSSSGITKKKVALRAQNDFHKLIALLGSEKETTVDVVLEEFVNILQSIFDTAEQIKKEDDEKQESKITVPKLKEYMKKYGLTIGNRDKNTMMDDIRKYEEENQILDGLFKGNFEKDDITVKKLNQYMEKYGLKVSGNKAKEKMADLVWNYEVDNDINDGLYKDYE